MVGAGLLGASGTAFAQWGYGFGAGGAGSGAQQGLGPPGVDPGSGVTGRSGAAKESSIVHEAKGEGNPDATQGHAGPAQWTNTAIPSGVKSFNSRTMRDSGNR
jgi:hypothetical protein